MAMVERRRRLASNPGRRRRLSAKQIPYFGTKRQRAAQKAKRRHAAAASAKHTKRSGPKSSRRQARSNSGEILALGVLGGNPGVTKERGGQVAKSHSKKSKGRRPVTSKHGKSRRQFSGNPGRRGPARHHKAGSSRRHRPRHNPIGGRFGSTLINAGWTIGGAVGTRMLTQLVLKDKNTGWMGYGANVLASFVLGWGVSKGLRNPNAGQYVTLGGFVGLVLRLLQDLTPFGEYAKLQGVRGDVGMGFLEPTTYFVPLAPADGRGATSAAMALPASVEALRTMQPTGLKGLSSVGRVSRASRFA